MISSGSNSQIKNIIQLQKKGKLRREQGVFVVEGEKMVKEARNHHLVKAYAAESYYAELIKNEDLYLEGFEYEIVADSVFKQMADTMSPQGILAIVKIPEYSLDEMLCKEDTSLLLLEDLRDPGNLGTIIRTAEGAGMSGVILSQESVDIFNPKVIRSTMGSIYRVPFVYVQNFKETMLRVKSQGVNLYAAHLHGRNRYDEEDYSKRQGILIGNESNGLSEETTKLADYLVKIPMEGQVESLNAAMAAGILMYESARQRRLDRTRDAGRIN